MLRKVQYALWALVVVAMVAAFWLRQNTDATVRPEVPKPVQMQAVQFEGTGVARDFALTAHTGEPYTSDQLEGQYRLMYFGYTSCPDKCPLDLAKMTLALAKLETNGVSLEKLQALFVTIDPERDDVAAMADTISLYHEKIVGLTGSVEEIAKTAKDFGVFYRKVAEEGVEDYLMDHLVAILLYDREGRLMRMFTPDQDANAMVKVLTPILEGAAS